MKTCPICDRDVLEEDTARCEHCGRIVCIDCLINNGNALDDVKLVCKSCCEEKHERV